MGTEEKRPRISVIIPVYDMVPWLDRCVLSVVNQTFTDLEICWSTAAA